MSSFLEKDPQCALRQTTSHSSLLVAHQGDLSRILCHAFLLVDSFNINIVDDDRSDEVLFTASVR